MTREEREEHLDWLYRLRSNIYVYMPKDWLIPMNNALDVAIKSLEQEQSFKWCTDCKEYDQENHCCHRWSKVIRDTVEEMKQEQEPMQVDLEGDGYADGELVYDYGKCPKCGWDFEIGDKDWEQPYCCHCGQKLKWFDNDAERNDKE